MHNKKSLIALGGVVAIAVVGALIYMTMGSGKPYKGTWIPKTLETGTTGSLEIKDNTVVFAGDFEIEEGKKASVTLTGDYKEVENKDGVYTLETSNPKAELKADGISEEMKKTITDSAKSSLEKQNKLKFKLSSDKKELTQITETGTDGEVYTKK